MTAEVLLVATTSLHAGFQLVVTALVYPALAATPPGEWPARHEAHSRRITPVVGLVYGAVLVALVPAVADGVGVADGTAVVGSVAAFALTALVAAPAHGVLGRGPDERVLHRLVVADRLRLMAAGAAALGAAVAAT